MCIRDRCSYDVRNQIVTDETTFFIRPDKLMHLNEITIQKTLITPNDLNKAVTLADVIAAFNDFVYMNFMRNNLSFCVVTYGDELLTKILANEAREYKLKLAPHFYQYFEVGTEFRKFYPQTYHLRTLSEMIQYLKLKEIPTGVNNVCQMDCKSVVRLINRLIKDGHKFQSPKIINIQHQVVHENGDDVMGTRSGRDRGENKRWSTYIRSKSPDAFRNPSRGYFIRLRGLPYAAREHEVLEFLRGIRVHREDICFLYDYDGKFTGESYVKLFNEADMKEALSFNLGIIGDRYIEVFETNENEYSKARNSQFPERREFNPDSRGALESMVRENQAVVKMRGLPYSCTEEDIVNFFRGLRIVKDGIKRAVVGGKPSGECMVIFENRDEALKAMAFDKEKIGSRFIELFLSNPREFENFMQNNFVNSAPNYSRDHMPNIPVDKKKSTLMVVGLPFQISKEEIMQFFKTFDVKDKDIHLLSSHSGKFSGNALITFEDEVEARRALKTKNLAYIGNRYIELYEYRQGADVRIYHTDYVIGCIKMLNNLYYSHEQIHDPCLQASCDQSSCVCLHTNGLDIVERV
eukprot:TRINITY_DN8390_c0_g1_i3.p1 TRINITY_DN8390_c0_g1~~TRINITY_DN8390_c0_g1_i3.p1  ORF type:complete len:598 (-),score=168.88 TRINITY_DN8390_c0_g1_i3:197-1930(-)